MFKTLLKNKKAQNTAEYALLIALVVAGVIAMQTYAQRALQARVRDASLYLANATSDASGGVIGATNQYEPYYLVSNYVVDRGTNTTTILDNNVVAATDDSLRTRQSGGFQSSNYSTAGAMEGI